MSNQEKQAELNCLYEILCLVLVNKFSCNLAKFNFTFTFNSFWFNLDKKESAKNNSILTRASNCLKYISGSGLSLSSFILIGSVPVQVRFRFKKNN